MKNWFQYLIECDVLLEQHINRQWANPAMDFVMPILRNAINWAPLYLLLIFWLIKKYKQQGLIIIAMLLLLVFFTDTISAQLLKPWISRLRPCWDENTSSSVRMLTGCGGRYSFPSNHAANHFAIAVFLFLSIKKLKGKNWSWLFVWAGAICYAQVYVGKHFPLDVIGGAIIGSIFAWLLFIGGKRIIHIRILNRQLFNRKKNIATAD